VAAIEHTAAINQSIAIGGPEAISWRDVIAAYEQALRRRILVNTIAPGELLPDLPPAPGLTEMVSGLMAGLETFDSPIDMVETARTFGVRQAALDEFVRREAALM
jgi:NADH dehydrogenase